MSRTESNDRHRVTGRGVLLGFAGVWLATLACLAALPSLETQVPYGAIPVYFEANRGIHRCIVEQTRNRYLVEMFDTIWNRGFSFHLFAAIGSRNLAKSLGDHVSLIEAIESGDVERTAIVFQDHITDGLDLQIAVLKAARES